MSGIHAAQSNSRIRYVLLDAVGTLIYPDPPVAQAYWAAGRRHGSGLNPPQIADRFRNAFADNCDQKRTSEARERDRWRDIVAQVFCDVPDAREGLFEELWQHFAQAEHWALFADVAPAWERLEAADVQVAIASNFDQRLLDICARLPPLNRAGPIFYSAAVGYSKPSALFFRLIQQQLDVAPEAILMLGDSQHNDIRPAQAAGWTALRVDRQHPSGDATTIPSLTEAAQRVSSGEL